jgi:hypothetical protein
MTQKQRNIFALKNFRGLDKENKLLKVQPYRATDGFNFIIDSETLKTRPSFTMSHDPNFTLESDDYLIDWYLYGTIYVYVTKKHIYLVEGNVVLNEKSELFSESINPKPIIRSPFSVDFNFENLKPIFQEEKNALFIFGLNEIYVVSSLVSVSNKYYILYNLKDKPTSAPSDIQAAYNEFPTPYVPTILLGQNAFEDVNLLSNQSKYQLFAEVPTTTLGTTTYNLPTYYNQAKHGDFTNDNIAITFYKNKYPTDIFPVFMGVQSEDWFGSLTSSGTPPVITVGTYGQLINTTTTSGDLVAIENTFFPTREFQYNGTLESNVPIYERINLDKKTFFNMIVKNTNNQTVFEWLQAYITTNRTAINSWTDNKVFAFALEAQNEATFLNNDGVITQKVVLQKPFIVYVQMRKFDFNITYTDAVPPIKLNTATVTAITSGYPDFPTFTNTLGEPALELDSLNPILVSGTTTDIQTQFRQLAIDEIARNLPAFNNAEFAGVKARLYRTFFSTPGTTNRSIIFPSSQQENVLEVAISSNSPYTTPEIPAFVYPTEPEFLNPDNFSVKSFDVPFTNVQPTNQSFTFTPGTSERSHLETQITNFLNSGSLGGFNRDKGFGIFKARYGWRTVFDRPIGSGDLTFYGINNTAYVVVKVAISDGLVPLEERFSIIFETRVNKTPQPIQNNLIIKTLKEEKTIIELKVKDYFFDYKNEPSIEVLVTFQNNTDYNIIAKSKFGITFGSENRLFLAGNDDFKNIDRFNISNDLLGGSVRNQSYELSYFPSKNYRVLGGKGAINGYVIATDNQLYITKENYPNDSKLFIRQRNINEQGLVSFSEFKTNITKTPLNPRCIVRFYNDILVLAKDGLFGIEISQNVLTDERLVKLRSGFINRDLVNAIANYNVNKVFILENNIYMYIFIGNKVYVADSRYITQNPNSAAENVSYEIIEWQVPTTYIGGRVVDDKVYISRENNSFIYSLEDFNSDELAAKQNISRLNYVNTDSSSDSEYHLFQSSIINGDLVNAKDYTLRFRDLGTRHAYIRKGDLNNGFTISGTTVTISSNNIQNFVDINQGDTLYWFNGTSFIPFTIVSLLGVNQFTIPSGSYQSGYNSIYSRITNKDLYVKYIIVNGGNTRLSITHLKPENVVTIASGLTDTQKKTTLTKFQNILFSNADLTLNATVGNVFYVFKKIRIPMRWVSAITDFGNSQMEKTSFRVNLYATKKDEANDIAFGYRTMRRMAGFASAVDLSSNFDFEEVDYSQFTMATFNTTALSFPMKENNFLYIQFTLNGVGKIEMNGVEVIYKLNRMLKSVG